MTSGDASVIVIHSSCATGQTAPRTTRGDGDRQDHARTLSRSEWIERSPFAAWLC
jgi:hypothetical protein